MAELAVREERGFTAAYQRAVAVLLVALFFTGVTVWSFDAGVSPVAPNRWVALAAGLTLPFLVPLQAGRAITSRVAAFMVFYIGITAARFLFVEASDAAIVQVQYRLFAMAFLAVALVVFADPRTHRPARLAVVGAVLAGTALNVYDITHPLTFSRDFGRAGGFYVNANVSSMALTLGMLIGIGVTSGLMRHLLVLVTGLGVLLTQSRSGALVYTIAVLVLAIGHEIRLRRLVLLAAAALPVAVAALALSGYLQPLVELVGSGEILRLTRLTSVTGVESEGDFQSTQSRIQVAQHAWETFAAHPLVGGGLGASGYTAHNMYLTHAADHGVLGLLIYPAFVLTFFWDAVRARHAALVAAGVGLLVWGFFSHNVLDEMHMLLGVALASSIARHARETGAAGEGAS